MLKKWYPQQLTLKIHIKCKSSVTKNVKSQKICAHNFLKASQASLFELRAFPLLVFNCNESFVLCPIRFYQIKNWLNMILNANLFWFFVSLKTIKNFVDTFNRSWSDNYKYACYCIGHGRVSIKWSCRFSSRRIRFPTIWTSRPFQSNVCFQYIRVSDTNE